MRTQDIRLRIGEVAHALGLSVNKNHIHCPFPDHPDKNPSFRIDTGASRYFCSCSNGDVFTMIMRLYGCGFKEALRIAKEALGEHPNVRNIPARKSATITAVTSQQNHKAEADIKRRLQKARSIWRSSKPITKDSLGWHYLRHERGITIDIPSDCRFVESIWHPASKKELPAIVCAIRNLQKEVMAVHVISLASDGKQASQKPAKVSYGLQAGNAIQLAPAGETLAITEGVEDALSIIQANPNLPCWATGGTSGFGNIMLPACVREVIFCIDRDPENHSLVAAEKAAKRLLMEKRRVKFATPPLGYKDFNALLENGKNQ